MVVVLAGVSRLDLCEDWDLIDVDCERQVSDLLAAPCLLEVNAGVSATFSEETKEVLFVTAVGPFNPV